MKYRYLVNGIAVHLTPEQAQALALQGLSVARSWDPRGLYYTDAAKVEGQNALTAMMAVS